MERALLITAILTGFSWSITDSFVLATNCINLLFFIYLLSTRQHIPSLKKWIDVPIFSLIFWRIIDNLLLGRFNLKILTKNLKFMFDISPIFIFRKGLWKDYYAHIIHTFLWSLSLITILSFLELLGFLKLGLFENNDLLGFHRHHIKSGFIWSLGSVMAFIIGIKRKNLTLLFLCFPLLVTGLLLTHSRSYYVGFLVAIVFIAALTSLKYYLRYILYGSIALASVFFLMLSIDSVRYRFLSIFTGIHTDGSIKCRIFFMKEAIKVFLEKPLTGLGYAEWSDYFSKLGYTCPDYHVHNIYLHELAETGIVGFILLAGLIVYILIYLSVRYLKQEEDSEYILIGVAAIVLFSVGGLFEPNLVKTVVMVPTFTLVGMALSVIKYMEK